MRYGRRKNRKKTVKTILFIVLLLVLMFLAYSVVDPVKKLLSGELGTSSSAQTSSQTVSKGDAVSSEIVSSEPEAVAITLKATSMSIATAKDQTKCNEFLTKAKADGYTAVMIELKDQNGKIWFHSEALSGLCKEAVQENGLSAQELAEKIKASGMIPVVAVHTFKDKTAPNKAVGNTFLVTGKQSTWWDNSADKGGKPWLNPHTANARAYNVKVVEELAKAGFEEIVLRSVQFPDISYKPRTDMSGEKTTAQILTQYIAEAKAAAEPHGAKVTVSYDSISYWSGKEIAYGGETGKIQSARISPVIRISDYGKKLTIGETVVENPSADITKTVQTVLSAIRTKTEEQKSEIIPIIASDQDTAKVVSALQTAGVESYIVE